METDLSGRNVLVTGASSGIGRAVARAFAREGANVAVTYRSNAEAAAGLCEEIREAGGDALALEYRLEEPGSGAAVARSVAERWGGLDTLVANAVRWPAEFPDEGRAESLSMETWRGDLRVNLEGTIEVVLAALPLLRRSEAGRIVLTSSGVAEEGVPGPSPYGVAKAALAGFARQLAWDVGRDGVLVNAVAAGFTATERNLAYFDEAVRDEVARHTPTGRLSAPEDVAGLIVYLGSPANRNLSGEVVREGSSTGRGGVRMEWVSSPASAAAH
jgi:Dehydrogenases with different specificities (related to short-chain alcohol dehydrogenases)